MQAAGKDVINMGVGSPDLAPSEGTIQALIDSASDPENHGYQPYKGIPSLRKAIADWYLGTYKVSLHPETEILPLMGSKEGITHISLTFLDPGDEVLVPELGYPAFSAVSQMVGAVVKTYPLLEQQGWQPDFDALYRMDCTRVKMMWVNYPHMPTGAPATESLFEQLVQFALDKQILLCHDNPYSLVLNKKSPISLLSVPNAKDVCLELNSMSKSHNMAGWRIGWIAGAQEYLDEVIKIKSNFDSGMFKGLQEAAVQALQNSPQWHEARNNIYRERRNLVFQILDILDCSYNPHQEGLFVWAKIPDSFNSVESFVDPLLYEKNIFFTPGFIFGIKGNRYIRLSLCNDVKILNEVLTRISEDRTS
jgi:aspartate/methionine/tyrosine aminotransferase